MSTSTDALLYYGFDLPDGLACSRSDVLIALGINPPLGEEDEDWEQAAEEEHLLPLGVTIGSHCSLSWPIFFVAAADSCLEAYRGSPHTFDDLPSVPEEVKQRLRDYAAALGLPPPSWHLASVWDG